MTIEDVQPLIDRLVAAGGTLLGNGDTAPHSGFGGYVEDADENALEVAWNLASEISEDEHVTFAT